MAARHSCQVVRRRIQSKADTAPDHSIRASDHAAVAKHPARTLVLDGGVVFDQQLRSRFEWLREPDPAAVATPPILIAFDIMYRDRRDPAGLPLSARRIHLEDVLADGDLPVRRLAANGLDAWAQVVGNGYEGLVARDEASVYEGEPTRRWLKVKQKNWIVDDDRWKRRLFREEPL